MSKDSSKAEILRLHLSQLDDGPGSARISTKDGENFSTVVRNMPSIGSPKKNKMNLREYMTNMSPSRRKYALTAKGGRRSPGLEEYGLEVYDTSFEDMVV